MIPLSKAAILYCTKERNILNWAKKYKITTSRIGGTLMIDEAGLARIIELNAKISHYDEYLEDILKFKEEELSNVIIQIDDLIYLFKSIKKISPLLRVLADETALLIPDDLKRNIYKETLLSKKMSYIAKKYDLSYDKACYMFDSAIKCVSDRLGFLTEYHNNIEEKDKKIKKLEIINRNQKNAINKLSFLLSGYTEASFEQLTTIKIIPDKELAILSMRFDTDFDLEFRIVNCLRAAGIDTMEDLLRFIRRNEVGTLLNLRNFGVKSLDNLKLSLINLGFIDSDWDSYLSEYL